MNRYSGTSNDKVLFIAQLLTHVLIVRFLRLVIHCTISDSLERSECFAEVRESSRLDRGGEHVAISLLLARQDRLSARADGYPASSSLPRSWGQRPSQSHRSSSPFE